MRLDDQVIVLRRMLALTDRYLDIKSRILDFGCGAGEVVYQFRDAGFDASGFDIHDYLKLRSPHDRRFFDVSSNGFGDNSIMSVDWDRFKLPYADRTFDLVVSSQALEHVLNLQAVLSELARVTKRDGIGIHIFPPKYRLREPHSCVPLGGLFKSFHYNLLWASLGIRNEFQQGLSAAETAKRNAEYAKSGTRYLSVRELRQIGNTYFEGVRFGHDLWHFAWRSYGFCNWRLTRPALLGYTLVNQIVWILERPKGSGSHSVIPT